MSDSLEGHIAQANDSMSSNRLLNEVSPKVGEKQTIQLQAQTPKYDTSILPNLEVTNNHDNKFQAKASTDGGTGKPLEAHATTNVSDGGTSKSHYASAYDNPQQAYQPQHAPAVSDVGGYHGWVSFPPVRDANGSWHQPGMIDLQIKPGQYHEGTNLGDLQLPALKGRSNHYNYLLNAHYENGKLVGTPAHCENGRVMDSYPKEVGIKCRN